MPSIKMNSSAAHEAEVDAVLPKKPLTETILLPAIMKKLKKTLIEMLQQEIEIYRAIPKTAARFDIKTFNTRNPKSCFMGQGFDMNGQGVYESWENFDLKQYRQRVGTISHSVWGNCTILELWGADHFEEYPDMVKEVLKYGMKEIDVMPEVKFHIMPLFNNSKSGTWLKTTEDEEEEAHRESILVQGIVANYKGNSKKSTRKKS